MVQSPRASSWGSCLWEGGDYVHAYDPDCAYAYNSYLCLCLYLYLCFRETRCPAACHTKSNVHHFLYHLYLLNRNPIKTVDWQNCKRNLFI